MPTKKAARPAPARSLKIARCEVFRRHIELRMLGFDDDDLTAIKRWLSMRWDHTDRVWIIDRRDYTQMIDVLEEFGFLVRVIEADL